MANQLRWRMLVALVGGALTTQPITAQPAAKGVAGKRACALLSGAEIQKATGRNDVAKSPGKAEEVQFTSNCQYFGAVDITIHLGDQTTVMFGRQRDAYAKAPARLGYKVEPVSGLGDDAYYLTYSGKAEIRAMVGGTELAVSLSGSLPKDPDLKAMAINLARAAVGKLR